MNGTTNGQMTGSGADTHNKRIGQSGHVLVGSSNDNEMLESKTENLKNIRYNVNLKYI